MKKIAKIFALTIAAVLMISVFAACGNSEGPKDPLAGTWEQKDETNGNWTFVFDGYGKCSLKGDYYSGAGTYSVNEPDKKLTITKVWDEEKVLDYTLEGDNLELKNTYQHFVLKKAE